jgi:FkbM family methyltransferase
LPREIAAPRTEALTKVNRNSPFVNQTRTNQLRMRVAHVAIQLVIRWWINSGGSLPEKGGPTNVRELVDQFYNTYAFRGVGRLRTFLTKLFMPAANGSTVIPTPYGFNIVVDPTTDRGLEHFLYFYGTFEAGTLHTIRKCLRQNDVFIDIGANIGLMSLLASRLIGEKGKVFAFEPESETFAILERNIEMNRITNVRTFRIALGSASTTEIIYSNLDRSRGSASLIKTQGNSEGVPIQVETLDKFITTNQVADIRMMKIDVEGWELEVLRGARQLLSSHYAPIICIEYSSLHPLYNGQILDLYEYILNINQYRIYKLERGKEIESKLVRIEDAAHLPSHDNLFCFLPTHLRSLDKNLFQETQFSKR